MTTGRAGALHYCASRMRRADALLLPYPLLCVLVNADLLSVFAQSFKADDAVGEGEEGIVFADADVVAGVELGAALADENVAGEHGLAVGTLDAEEFCLAVSTVMG